MAFHTWDPSHLARFNSSCSSDFLDFYEGIVEDNIRSHNALPTHKTFAPSSFRCDRISWFRLRGTQPDTIKNPDKELNFTAEVGTACHRIIQTNLAHELGSNWISARDHLSSVDVPYFYSVQEDEDSLESLVQIEDPPVRFACDGIIVWKGKKYLLEIKTSELSSWRDLTDPKPEHIDQVKCYATLLKISDILFLYQERQYGGLKCYEYHVSDPEMDEIMKRIRNVVDLANKNLAPDPLPKGDKWCTESRCPYYKKCQEYGR